MINNKKMFVVLALTLVPMLAWAAPSSPKIEEVITNYDGDELVIMGSDLSDGVNTPLVELGGFMLVVTDFDTVSITADAVLNSFVPGDYLLVVEPDSKSKPLEILLSLNPPAYAVAGRSCDMTVTCGNGVVENGAPMVGFAEDGSVICMYPEECDDGNLTNLDGCSATCTNETPPAVVLTKTAPGETNLTTITYTIDYDYPAQAWLAAENLVLTDTVPAGTNYVNLSATGGGTHSAGVVTWNLPNMNPGDSGSVSFQVSVLSDGVYENTAELQYSEFTNRMVSSNTTVTERDTISPVVTITGPDGATTDGTSTSDTTPSFNFSASESPVTFECKVDLGAYAACSDPYTSVTLSGGLHTVSVRATDPAGNFGTATRTFNIAVVCGDGILDPLTEQCDDGNSSDSDDCTNACTVAACGDGIVWNLGSGSEQCDDGNLLIGDGCSDVCTIESVCGNGIIEPPETCDDGNILSGDGCSAVCSVEILACGDGIVHWTEQCDDGNLLNGDGCSDVCTIESICGNGIIEPPEMCDDGNLLNGDGCSDVCTIESVCGNGNIEPPETCDDGNTTSLDGCSATCTIEVLPAVVLTKAAPSSTNLSTITYTIDYDYPAESWYPAENLVLTDAVPAGSNYVNFSATGGGTHSAGVVTWNLPNMNPGDSGSVSFQVSVLSDGSYENTAELQYSEFTNRMVSSNTTVTERDTISPAVTITGPDGATTDGTSTSDTTPSFDFSASESPVTFECRVDFGAYGACITPFTTLPLGTGLHTVDVRATDLAGNTGVSAARTFNVVAVCGDGIVDPLTEQCDDGNASNGDSCTNACTIAICGDGFLFPDAEECDDGNSSNLDHCTNACNFAACGDGYVHTGFEACDDGNTLSGDGCSEFCIIE